MYLSAGCRQAWRMIRQQPGIGLARQIMRAPTIRRSPTRSASTPRLPLVFRFSRTWASLPTLQPATWITAPQTVGWISSAASRQAAVATEWWAWKTNRSWKTQTTGAWCLPNDSVCCSSLQRFDSVATHTHSLTSLTALTGKVEPICILLKQETVSGSGISWAVCKSAPRSRQATMPAPHHSVYYRPDALPVAQTTASEHWGLFVIQGWRNLSSKTANITTQPSTLSMPV